MSSLFVTRMAVSDIKKRGRQIEVNHFNQSPKDFLAILPGNQMPLILCRGFSYFLASSPHSNQYPLIIFRALISLVITQQRLEFVPAAIGFLSNSEL